MIDRLLLNSGNDIPFPEARLVVHVPTLKQIAFLNGEYKFWSACQILKLDKNSLNNEIKFSEKITNLDIILKIIQERNMEAYQAKTNILSLLSLLFPAYEIHLKSNLIELVHGQTKQATQIDNDNFENFKEILIDIFCLKSHQNEQYNPSGELAKKIVEKIKKGRLKKVQLEPQSNKEITILDRYVSILSVGLQKDKNILMNYTIYQIIDEFNRFLLKLHYDSWVQWKVAGAEGMQDPEDWLKDIYQNKKDELL